MVTVILIGALVLFAGGFLYMWNDRNNTRRIYTPWVGRMANLPLAAKIVSPVSRCETPEYNLQQALIREGRLEERAERLERENRALTAQKLVLINRNAELESSYGALEQDYRRQFQGARGLVSEATAMLAENARLRASLAEEVGARLQAEAKVRRLMSNTQNLVH